MSDIAPFATLEKGESELSKKDIAAFLDTYFNFLIEMFNNEEKTFMDNFINSKNRREKDISVFSQKIRSCSFYAEYDYMLQIAELFTIIKVFSYYIDSNLFKIGDIGRERVDDKFFLSDSTRYNKIQTINFIRNALNHNDKKDFELFRLTMKQGDPKIYIEIYLRNPNFHIKVTVDELVDLLKPVLKSKSLYAFTYFDKEGNVIKSPEDLLKIINEDIDDEIYYEINHATDFDENDISNGLLINYGGQVFKIKIPFTKEQKNGIKIYCDMLKTNDSLYNSIIYSRVIEEVIPFGMSKVNGFLNDFNNFLHYIYDYDKKYIDFIYENAKVKTTVFEDSLQIFDNFYYAYNRTGRTVRGLVLLLSNVLDSIIPEEEQIEINGDTIAKTIPRDSLVHGTYSSAYGTNILNIALFDYEHKDRRNRTDNTRIMQDYNLKVFDIMDLYEMSYNLISPLEYSLPLDIIISRPKFDGFKFIFKDRDKRYYINASFDQTTPIFLGLIEINGETYYMDDRGFDLFKEKIDSLSMKKYLSMLSLEDEQIEFIKNIPDISRNATARYTYLITTNKLSNENYFGPMMNEIKTLSKIVHNNPYIPEVSETRVDSKYVSTYHYWEFL